MSGFPAVARLYSGRGTVSNRAGRAIRTGVELQLRLRRSPGTPSIGSGANTMSKTQKSNKETKKQALLTPKEKKAAKQLKKHAGEVAPLIVKGA
jgi:hypothetical protein